MANETTTAMGEHIERFVPAGKASLVDDAPGWSGGEKNHSSVAYATPSQGPICWKCRGSGQEKVKASKKRPRNAEGGCSVCKGTGHLPVKKQEALALQDRCGEITRVRSCPPEWKPRGPQPWALQQCESKAEQTNNQQEAIRLVQLAESSREEIPVRLEDDEDSKDITNSKLRFDKSQPLPKWLPRRGEQLCNLAGSWRILQRVASHRWTTDDLVTSYLAGHVLGKLKRQNKPFRYLDLGCGNGSVLLMTTWQLCSQLMNEKVGKETTPTLICTGIEARQEAVQLARRSIAFNVGETPSVDIQVHHGDFRSILGTLITESSQQYDLVTGTPPYFRVDFTVENKSNVQKAVIQQGGMPTCKQSAPARCEFRGGVEAYCKAAATAMHTESVFCVCENWLNNDRVYQGAQDADLVVTEVLPVQGRTGKPCPLFAVYVMRKKEFFEGKEAPATKTLDCLVVRDDEGSWTGAYQKVLGAMSIPVVP